MKKSFYYLIVEKNAAARLKLVIAKEMKKDNLDPLLDGIVKQLKKQEPLPTCHEKKYWERLTKAELIDQLQLFEKLVNYAGNRYCKLSKEAARYEKEDS